jgi:predicted dithiol-disulfide oxidoreductase (DUF899 family)
MWVHPLTKVDPAQKKLTTLAGKIAKLEKEARTIRAKAPRQRVKDYELTRPDGGTVKLSDLFGKHDKLVLVHNMGKTCGYCTMWADGFNALWKHVEDQAAFAVANNDPPADQARVAKARGWTFPMVSARGTTLFRDLGFADAKEQWYPGASTLVRTKNGGIERYAAVPFGPGDKFNSVFSFFELLPAPRGKLG